MGARGPKPRDIARRFAEKVEADERGCWVWRGTRNNRGYGMFYVGPGKSPMLAHRWAFLRWNDAIPDGLELDHLCRNRACANPWHVEPVTRSTNLLRGLRSVNATSDPSLLRRAREGYARRRARIKEAGV
jgi:hypothetical protein